MADPLFLLDTNICIYLLGGLSAQARDRLSARRSGEVVTSSIVYAEVMRGIDVDDAVAMDASRRFFRIVEVRAFDAEAGLAYRRVPFRRAQFDRLIAAHALALGLTIATANERDFADISGLRVENWTLPL